MWVCVYIQAATDQPFGIVGHVKPCAGERVSVLRVGEEAHLVMLGEMLDTFGRGYKVTTPLAWKAGDSRDLAPLQGCPSRQSYRRTVASLENQSLTRWLASACEARFAHAVLMWSSVCERPPC